jgi:hypothetical protein
MERSARRLGQRSSGSSEIGKSKIENRKWKSVKPEVAEIGKSEKEIEKVEQQKKSAEPEI